MYLKELQKKNWIDWIKMLVAVDIAGAGVGLILNVDMHVFGYLFRVIGLGFLSRIFFGVLYVFVAVLIFKRVFPQKLAEEEHEAARKMDEEIVDTTFSIKQGLKKMSEKASELNEKIHDKFDELLDRGEHMIKKGKQDAKNEIDKLMNE